MARRPSDVAPAAPLVLPDTGIGRGWEPTVLALITLALLSFGLVCLYSASSVLAQRQSLPDFYYVSRQAIGALAGLLLLGGAALITAEWAFTRGPLILLPYGALVLMTAFFLRHERVQRWGRRFALSLGSFMVATLALYLFIGAVLARTLLTISVAGHAWRLALMTLVGMALSAAVAQLTATKAVA